MRWVFWTVFLVLFVVSANAGLLLSYGQLYPSGPWASGRYMGGASFGLSGEWPVESHVVIVLPILSYSELGADRMLPGFILSQFGEDVSHFGEIKSNLWYAGMGVKGIIFPKSYITPTLGVDYAYFNRGVTIKGIPLPVLPNIPSIPTNFNAGGGGFLLTYGIKLANPLNISLDLEFRNFWAKGLGNSEVEEFLGMPSRSATGFHLVGSLELM